MNDPFDYSDKPDSTDEHNNDHQPSASRTARFASYLAIAALCFTAIGVTVGYKHWLRISDRAKLALVHIEAMQKQIDAKADSSALQVAKQNFESASQLHSETLESTLEKLNAIKQETLYAASTVETQIEELTQLQAGPPQIRTSMTRAEARLAEIRFLLESANNRLKLSYDKTGALDLLKAADLMLIRIGSTDLLPARKKLQKDISTLEEYALPDTKDLLASITEMERTIQPLSELLSPQESDKTITIFNNVDDNKSLTGRLKNYVNSSISITKNTQPPKKILNTVNKQRIDQLMKLRLTALRLNILERQDNEFHYQISEINKMLDQYYSQEQSKHWQKRLSVMDDLTLNPSFPKIDNALQFIKNGLSKDKNL